MPVPGPSEGTDAETRARYDLTGRTVWIAGHRGMVGSALVRRLSSEPCRVLTVDRSEVDLRDAGAVRAWLRATRPDVAVIAAARVGGILANSRFPADFLHDNLAIADACIDGARDAGVGRLLFLGSSCIYPRDTAQPITEDALLTGPLEATNQWYAIAKIAGVKLCQAYRRQHGCDFISAMPTNLYGPGDNFHPDHSHVLPALLRRIHEAKRDGLSQITVWGTGAPKREFLHVDDLADACVHLLGHYHDEAPINVGTGVDVAIRDLVSIIADVVGWTGDIHYDTTKPDGTPRKWLDVSRLSALGWAARTPLHDGIAQTYRWYLDHQRDLRAG